VLHLRRVPRGSRPCSISSSSLFVTNIPYFAVLAIPAMLSTDLGIDLRHKTTSFIIPNPCHNIKDYTGSIYGGIRNPLLFSRIRAIRKSPSGSAGASIHRSQADHGGRCPELLGGLARDLSGHAKQTPKESHPQHLTTPRTRTWDSRECVRVLANGGKLKSKSIRQPRRHRRPTVPCWCNSLAHVIHHFKSKMPDFASQGGPFMLRPSCCRSISRKLSRY